MHNAITPTWFAFLASLATSLACDANLGSVATSDSGTEGDETSSSGGSGGEPLPCIGGELCAMGTTCSNGLCATDCMSGGDCDDDEFCGLDGLCHSNTISSCGMDSDCAPTQICVDQVCTVEGASCALDNVVQDGCPSNAVCLENLDQVGQGVCHAMPACAADQTCPIGLYGAVCNTGQLITKDEICLIGACDEVEHCPGSWSCVHLDNSVIGVCSDGGFASPCSLDEHCLSGTCVPILGLGGGICN
jgi:hypothetical protein